MVKTSTSSWPGTFATIAFLVLMVGTDGSRQPRAAGQDVFADLSVDEMNQITEFLEKQSSLNLVRHKNAKVSDSYVFLMEALRPNKADALRYLDENGAVPIRTARVIIFRGDLVTPAIQQYNVHPIPNPNKYELTQNPTWKNPIPFHSRSPLNGPEEALFEALLVKKFAQIADIVSEATDGYTYTTNCTKKCLRWFPAMPATAESGHHKMTAYFVRGFEGGYLYPIGLQFVLNLEDVDETRWSIESVWFQGQRFRSFEEMAEAKRTNTLHINVLQEPETVGKPTLPSSMNFRGTPRPSAPKRGPASFMPDGNRFDINGRRISWLGWEFNYAMLTSTGLQLHDVRFLGERMVYELALQEVSVFYSGGSPVPSHTNYFDSVIIFGLMTSEMFRGIDCPQYAQFFDFTHYMHGTPHIFKNGACVFELDRGVPLRRHYESDHKGGYSFAQGMPDVVLVFRQILAVWNYDYIVDTIFHQAGQIEVKVTLSGYVLATYYTGANMDKYGHRINDNNAIGNVHHHTVNFKVDLDVKGTENRFETIDIKLEDVEDSLSPGDMLKNRYIVRSLKENELDAAYKYNFDSPKYLVVFNENEKNRFGDHRGYRIVSEAMSKLLLPDSYRGFRSRSWTGSQVAVTKFSEDERCSSSMFTAMEPFDPPMSFSDFGANNENIVDEDLVVWVTLGVHHIPHTEDVPVVTSPGVQLTFFLIPYNYFDEDPSLASRDNIRVTPGPDGKNVYQYAGVPAPPTNMEEGGKSRPAKDISSAGASLSSLSCLILVCLSAIMRNFV